MWRSVADATCGLGLVLATGPAAAQAPREWLSETGRTELAPAALVCLGTVRSVRTVRGAVLVELTVDEVLAGAEPAASVRVLATDARAFEAGERCLWLLATRAPGLYQPRGRHVLGNPEGDERLAVLRAIIRIEAMADPAERREALKRLLLENLDGREWTRWHALRELFVLVERVPGFLTPDEVRGLEARLDTPQKKSFHQYLVTTVCRAQAAPAIERFCTGTDGGLRGAATAVLVAIPPVRRTAYLIGRARGDPDPDRRARLCELLGILALQDRATADAPGPPAPRTAAATAAAEQVTALRRALVDDPAPAARASAAQALAWCDPACGGALLAALDAELAPAARGEIALVAARLKLSGLEPRLCAALAADCPPILRATLELALWRVTYRR